MGIRSPGCTVGNTLTTFGSLRVVLPESIGVVVVWMLMLWVLHRKAGKG